ncbi:DUF2637 domain-containing protein [Cellulosimicrobium sp. TH-20]|uniref:DUF2637 domain-containing protein n=1 Tax=Cellulosimicrobium sp. TH-20 TaxID=1980001 RepID=UPI0011A1BD24|nr:DUF2637 domain-containing protein [Cellulosimicrobium sp. TH-20]
MSRPVSRLNPDAAPVHVFAVVSALVVLGASFLWSWDALQDVAAWAAVVEGRAWVVPLVVDGAIVVYTAAVLVIRARGQKPRLSWAALFLFTGVSVYFNAAHAWAAGEHLEPWQRVAGTVLAGLAPVAVLLATHTVADLLVGRHGVPEPVEEPAPTTAPVPVVQPFPGPYRSTAYFAQVDAAAEMERDGALDALLPETSPAPVPEPVSTLAVPSAPIVKASRPARRPAASSVSSETQAEALRLRTEERLSVSQIAERLDVPRSTAGRLVAGVPAGGAEAVPTLSEALA